MIFIYAKKRTFILVDKSSFFYGDPKGIRTPIATVKGWCPNH